MNATGSYPTDQLPATPAEVVAAVHAHLEQFFAERRAELSTLDPWVARAAQYVEEFTLGGGKRIRPLFAWAGYLAHPAAAETAESPAAIVQAISALELIQACALVHDDIIDSSDTRRGNPTVHRRAEADHGAAGWLGDGAEFGRSLAILVGDLALAWADDMFLCSGVNPAALARAVPVWRAMRTEVIAGQMLDICLEASGSNEEAKAMEVNELKTAAYTIKRPLQLGAALAGAPSDVTAHLGEYGHNIGIAFQLRDDLLGVFGDPRVTGKPAGDDLKEGKRTVLVCRALSSATEQQAAQLEAGLGADLSAEQVRHLSDLIRQTGAPAEIEEMIAALVEQGFAAVDVPAITAATRSVLHQLGTAATERKA